MALADYRCEICGAVALDFHRLVLEGVKLCDDCFHTLEGTNDEE